jgi:hypothetical protein
VGGQRSDRPINPLGGHRLQPVQKIGGALREGSGVKDCERDFLIRIG